MSDQPKADAPHDAPKSHAPAPLDLKGALAALDRVRKVVHGHPDNSIVLVKAIHDALDG